MFGRASTSPLISEIDQVSSGPIQQEQVVQVRTAKVLCANYRAIVHDFPQVFGAEAIRDSQWPSCDRCRASGRACREAINAWLIRNAGFISARQLAPNSVNSPIETGDVIRTAYRPPAYGRAVVIPIDSPAKPGQAGFLDLKGVGVAPDETPSHKAYSDGLEYLGYALADFFYGWLVDLIFSRTCPGYHVLPVYAVLDLGFDIVDGWHGTAPAGLHVRRAHARPIPTENLPMSGADREKLLIHAELLLRTFGLSTTGNTTSFKISDEQESGLVYGDNPVVLRSDLDRKKASQIIDTIRDSGGTRLEIMNVQATSHGSWDDKTQEIFDFGQVGAFHDFWHPVANLIRNGALSVGRIISPRQPAFVRPSSRLAFDPKLFNRHSVNAYGFYAAQKFRNCAYGFDQTGIEALLRIARLTAFRREMAWAHRRIAASRDSRYEPPVSDSAAAS